MRLLFPPETLIHTLSHKSPSAADDKRNAMLNAEAERAHLHVDSDNSERHASARVIRRRSPIIAFLPNDKCDLIDQDNEFGGAGAIRRQAARIP